MIDPGDEPPFPAMSPPDIQELSVEAMERQAGLKQEAVDALEDGKQDLALEKLTEAICLGCASALMYSRRGQILLSLGRPYAAINDCTAAVLIDSELASAFKTRARALSRLEQWTDASTDFREALQLNYDEVTYRESLEALAKEQSTLCVPEEQLEAPTAEASEEGEEQFPEVSPVGIKELTTEALDEQTGLKQESKDALEDGDVDVALEKISEAIALGCASASMYCVRAELLLLLSRPRAAVNDCGAALAVDPEAREAFEVRGRALGELQRWDDAHSNFLEALRLGAGEATRQAAEAALAHLAGVDCAMQGEGGQGQEPAQPLEAGGEPAFPPLAPVGAVDLSEAELERQAQLKEQCSEAMEAGDEGLALRSITAAITMGGATALMYCRRAQILLQLERPRAAVHDCTAALALNSGSIKALKLRARASVALEWWAEAQTYYTRALAIEDDGVVREELQAVESRMKEIQEASALAARRRWEIVGGADKGGVVVRTGLDVSSPQALDPLDGVSPYRLSSGAVVVEIELVGDRLHYQKISGSGPGEGWISITYKEKVLAIPVSSSLAVQSVAGQDQPEASKCEEPPFPAMSPSRVEFLTDEQQERQGELKQQATDALESGNEQLALEKLTAAIVLGCSSALMYCRRAHVLLQLGRPRAAVNDCTAALGINPDSGKAFKIRGRAHTKLRHWPEAHSDFQEGLRIDYDEDTYEESLGVESKMKGMKAIATEKRLQVERDVEKKRIADEKELEQLKVQAEMHMAQHRMQMAQQKAKEDLQMRKFERMYMGDQYGKVAWQQGYMTDFMGVKRGKCKCKKCPVYCWTPVRMSS